jgi:hypothetical protein
MDSAENPIYKTHSRVANRVGVGISAFKEAADWDQEILGFTLLKGSMEVRSEQGYRAKRGMTFWELIQSMLQARMVAANGFALEFFRLLDPPHQRGEYLLE